MNNYSELLNYLYKTLSADIFVNTVTQGDTDKIDLDKTNIFPLAHIVVDGASFNNGSTILFNVSIDVLNVRDINKDEVVSDKFWLQDNEIDNHNHTMAVLNRIWLILLKDFEKHNITASENPSIEKISFSGKNLLDGWSLSFDVETPNTTINLC